MNRSTTRWSTAVAAAALIALPVAASAQSTGTTPQPPTQTQSPAPSPSPTQPQSTSPSQPTASGQVDQNAAKQHLSAARDTLSQITSMPEAAKLQGDARTQVSQLISNFNELITTQANWRASYDKVDANLNALLGTDNKDPNAASTAGAVGTSGTAGTAGTAGTSGTAGSAGAAGAASAAASIDPAIRAKLVEFRAHLKMFEQAAGSGRSSEPRPGDTTGGAMPPAAATGSTSNPANPTATPDPSQPGQPPSAAGATGTSGSSAPTANMNPTDQAKASDQVGHAEADKHLDAISAILNKSKTGALTRAQTTELKKHVEELRRLLQQQPK